ncbi:hypothetical protein CFC21_014641 [Triticum aestivum]|uniref:Exocyst subunit Exo70 family protein n=2 Tax=Triticum aestivum TaxID=4565 RepID=A0A3B6AQC4_WHEAT|nr:uncharacterized protein LOC123191346 [Triticum aestivum]KAF6998525.1 hypothetical protein CFC21_014641 [Triticum aestivum]
MADLERLNISCNLTRTPAPLRPSCDPPPTLLAALVVLVFWLWGNLHLPPLPDGAPDPDHQIPAIPEDADEAEVEAAAIPPDGAGTPPRSEREPYGDGGGVSGSGRQEAAPAAAAHFRRDPSSIRYQETEGAAALPSAGTPPRGEREPYGAGGGASCSDRQEAAPAAAAHFRRNPSITYHEVAGADSVDMIRGGSCECDAGACVEVERRAFVHATFDRSGEAAGILQKMVDGFGTILLSADDVEESTIHLANRHLVEALESAHAIGCTADFLSQMLDGWACKLEGDARRIWQGEKCRVYIFLFSNAYDVLLIMRGRGAAFSNEELESMLSAMFRRYKASYLDECWAPLMNHLDRLDKFSAEFCIICRRQMTCKVNANLRYKLRKEIVGLIVPPYQVSFLAQRKNQSRLSRVLHCRKRVMAGKQKMRTAEELEMVINDLFEG